MSLIKLHRLQVSTIICSNSTPQNIAFLVFLPSLASHMVVTVIQTIKQLAFHYILHARIQVLTTKEIKLNTIQDIQHKKQYLTNYISPKNL